MPSLLSHFSVPSDFCKHKSKAHNFFRFLQSNPGNPRLCDCYPLLRFILHTAAQEHKGQSAEEKERLYFRLPLREMGAMLIASNHHVHICKRFYSQEERKETQWDNWQWNFCAVLSVGHSWLFFRWWKWNWTQPPVARMCKYHPFICIEESRGGLCSYPEEV